MFTKKHACVRCKSKISEKYDFCPHCGHDVRNPRKDQEDFGILGKNELMGQPMVGGGGLGITDTMINSLMRTLVKTLDKQMRHMDRAEVQNLPNGINIRFGVPVKAVKQKAQPQQQEEESDELAPRDLTEDQVKRMTGMPRTEAKTQVRRLSDKILYELSMTGVASPEDVFISRLESGYEVKAIGKKKVYVNSLPVTLPLKSYEVSEKGLVVEFGLY